MTGFDRWSYRRGKYKSPWYFPFSLRIDSSFPCPRSNRPTFFFTLSMIDSAWLGAKFAESYGSGFVVINQRHRIADARLLERTADNIASLLTPSASWIIEILYGTCCIRIDDNFRVL